MIAGAILIAVAALLWATTGIVAKFLFTGMVLQPLTLALLRLVVALPFFFALMRWETTKTRNNGSSSSATDQEKPRSGLAFILPLLALGLFQSFYQGSYLLAVDYTGAGIATLIALCIAPVLVAVFASPILGEKPSFRTLLALAAAIVGTVLLVLSDIESVGAFRWEGMLLALLAAFVYAGFTLTSRFNSTGTGIFATAFFCFLTAALLLLPVVWLSGGLDNLSTLTLSQWLMVIYIGIVPTCLGYLAFFQGMKTTPATLSSIIVTLEPLFVALLAWVFLSETLGPAGMIGATILTMAVVVASLKSPGQEH